MSILVFKNQQLETDLGVRDLSGITEGLIYGITPIPDSDIAQINVTPNFLYAANNLICLLDNGAPVGDRFGGPEIRVNAFWKVTDTSADGSEFSKYQRFETPVDVEIFTPGRISIKIRESDKEDVEAAYQARGFAKPDYGMLLVILNFVNRDGGQRKEFAYLLKYTHNPLFSTNFVSSSPQFRAITKNVYRSPPYSSETFFIPQISSSFIYNFFDPKESDYELYSERDYKKQKISDIPKYIKLTWNKPSFDSTRFIIETNPPLPSLSGIFQNPGFLSGVMNGFLTGGVLFTGSTPISTDFLSRTVPFFPENTQKTEPGNGVIRIGGLVLSQIGQNAELAKHMTDASSRTGVQAAGVFGGADKSFIPQGTVNGAIEISKNQQFEDSVFNGPARGEAVVDSFQTYLPRLDDLGISVAKNSDYVGYVIEKGRLTEDGQFDIVDIIAIAGKDTTEFLDWKIAYGETYRYRIRTIFRFVNTYNLPMFADTDAAITRQQSVQYIDSNVVIQSTKTFYFDSVYSDATEIQATENQRPNPPLNLRLFANSRKKQIFLTWNQKNQNRDVVGFNVYRKTLNNSNEPFVRLNSTIIEIRENYFIDTDININLDYIYAVEAIDFHGNFSPLSAQYSIRIREVIVDEQVCENLQKFFETEGRELGEVREEEMPSLIVCKKNISMNVNPLFQNTDENNTFVIRVTSLDTGHIKEIKVNFRTLTIYHMSGYVPAPAQKFLPFPGALGFFDAETLARLTREFGNRS